MFYLDMDLQSLNLVNVFINVMEGEMRSEPDTSAMSDVFIFSIFFILSVNSKPAEELGLIIRQGKFNSYRL